MRWFMLNKSFLYSAKVSKFTITINLSVYLRIIWENFTLKELFRQSKRFNFSSSDINKLRFHIVANIVISKELVDVHCVYQFKLFLVEWLEVQVIANTNNTFHYKVHFKHFCLLVINDILIVIRSKMSWLKSKRNII